MPHEAGERDLAGLPRARGRLPVDAVPIVATTDIPRVIDLGLGAIGGDLPVDGSIGARTAALAAPIRRCERDTAPLTTPTTSSRAFFHGGHSAGLQVGVHAIGDRAIEQVLTAWERVYQRARLARTTALPCPASPRRALRDGLRAAHVERAAMLGLAVSVQPAFDAWWGGPAASTRSASAGSAPAGMNPYPHDDRAGDRGRRGSDTPITPLDPLLAVAALESHHDPRQRLSRARGDPPAHDRQRPPRAPGGEEGCVRARHARGLRGLRRGSVRGVRPRGDDADPHGLARSGGVRAA